MKKTFAFILSFIIFISFILSLSSCGESKISSYYLDESGNLVAVYEDGNENNLGKWNEEIILSLNDIGISEDCYYIIDGIKTKIKINKIEVSNDSYFVLDGVKTNKKISKIEISEEGYYILDGITTNISIDTTLINGIDSITISDDGYYIVNGVKTSISAIEIYTVNFNTGFNKKLNSIKVKDGYRFDKPTLERDGYTLAGWYYNDEEWHFNTDTVKNDMTITAHWTPNEYVVKFVNDMGTNPSDITVKFDEKVELPELDEVEGYSFDGWYNGNTKVTDGEWTIPSDTTLTAHWAANEYTITLNPNGGSVSQTTVKVKYGESFTLPIPTNTYGAFTGWLYNDQPITDSQGKSLNNWNITSNITLTVDWTIKVYTVEDLQKLGTYLNGEFILMNDIDLDGVLWTPIGTQSKPFTGSLTGNGFSIKNLSIDTANFSNLDAFGLFGYISGAKIRNLNIIDFTFNSANISKEYSVGALSGVDLTVETNLDFDKEEESYINSISLSGVLNISKQSSDNIVFAGGLIGIANYQYIYNCYNSISIPSNAIYAGGLVGYASQVVMFNKCGNTGNISSSRYAGGLIGIANLGSVALKSYNTGNVSSVEAAGGLIGSGAYYVQLEECYNTGSISSTTNKMYYGAGGLVGNCYPEGDIQELPEASISNCYNKGSVSAPYAGGIIGGTYKITINNTYNCGNVSSSFSANGFYGFVATGTLKQCLSAGSISSSATQNIFGAITTTKYDCYYNFSSTSSFSDKTEGTYTSSVYGSSLYKNDLFWSEYNPTTKKGIWVFSDTDYPRLYWEEA